MLSHRLHLPWARTTVRKLHWSTYTDTHAISSQSHEYDLKRQKVNHKYHHPTPATTQLHPTMTTRRRMCGCEKLLILEIIKLAQRMRHIDINKQHNAGAPHALLCYSISAEASDINKYTLASSPPPPPPEMDSWKWCDANRMGKWHGEFNLISIYCVRLSNPYYELWRTILCRNFNMEICEPCDVCSLFCVCVHNEHFFFSPVLLLRVNSSIFFGTRSPVRMNKT